MLLFIKLSLSEVNILVDSLDTNGLDGTITMCDKSLCKNYFILSGTGNQQYVNKILHMASLLSDNCQYEQAVSYIEKLIEMDKTAKSDYVICVAGYSIANRKMEVTTFDYNNSNRNIDKAIINATDSNIVFLTYPVIKDVEMVRSISMQAKNIGARSLKNGQACQYIGDTLNEYIPAYKIGGALVLNTLFIENKAIHSNVRNSGYVTGVIKNELGETVCYSPSGIKVKGIDRDFDTIASLVKPDMRG